MAARGQLARLGRRGSTGTVAMRRDRPAASATVACTGKTSISVIKEAPASARESPSLNLEKYC
jgi:hypothetical protein